LYYLLQCIAFPFFLRCAVLIRVVSVQPILRAKNGSHYVTFHVIDKRGTRARMMFYGREKLDCERIEKQLTVIIPLKDYLVTLFINIFDHLGEWYF
jgi:hypothetical protein